MLSIEPGGVCRIVLDKDQGKPKPPVFLFPWLTGRQQRQLMRSYDTGAGASVPDMDSLFETLEGLLLGWENLPTPYAKGDLDLVVNVTGAFELINKLVMQAPSSAEKNAFGSPSA